MTHEDLESKNGEWNKLIYKADISEYIPMWEDWMIHHFDHRYQSDGGILLTEQDHNNPDYSIKPRIWINKDEIRERIGETPYLLAFRNRTNASDSRAVISTIIPYSAAGNTIPIIVLDNRKNTVFLTSLFSTYVFDFCARQKIGGMNLNYFILKQLPVLSSNFLDNKSSIVSDIKWKDWLTPRLLELFYVCWDLQTVARDCDYDGPPFVWDEERRFKIRTELDAAYFHLYLGTQQEWQEKGSKELLEYFPTPRHAVDYIMETFPIVKRKDEAKYGSYRTKELILEIYDRMTECITTGKEYKTILDPPPGPPCDAQGNFIPMSQWDKSNWPVNIHPPKGE
jgi:hypothetical protein